MKFRTHSQVFYLLFFPCFCSLGQNAPPIKLKKENGGVIFFQTGIKNDTLIKNKSDRFYLSVPENLKEVISIQTENGQFQLTEGDSILTLIYIPGLKYECLYIKTNEYIETDKSAKIKKHELKTLVNGVSNYQRDKILIQIKNIKEDKILIENLFFTRSD